MREKKETHKAPGSVSQSAGDVKFYEGKLAEMLHHTEDQLIDDFAAKNNLGARKKKHIAMLECPICWKNLGEIVCGCRFGYDHRIVHKCRIHQDLAPEEERRYWSKTEIVGQHRGLKITVMNYYPPLGAGAQIDEKAIVFDRRFYDALIKTGRMDLYNEVLEHERRELEICAELHKKQGTELSDFSDRLLKADIVARAHRMARKFDRKGFEKELKDFCQRNISKYYQRENNQIKTVIYTTFEDYISSTRILPETKKSLTAVLEREYGKGKIPNMMPKLRMKSRRETRPS